MVESGGLENRCTRKGTVGSNPTLSATTNLEIRNSNSLSGEVQEWLNWQHWKCCVRETVPWVRIPPSPPLGFGLGEYKFMAKYLIVLLSKTQDPNLNPVFPLSGSGSRAIARLRTPPGRERSNGSRSRMCRGHSGA